VATNAMKRAMAAALAEAKHMVMTRATAYQQVFDPESRTAQRVLRDLAKFCRAQESAYHADPRMDAVLEGRREVWLRISHFTKLDPDQLWKTYGKGLE
jgi:predicted alpha/beta hydrolase